MTSWPPFIPLAVMVCPHCHKRRPMPTLTSDGCAGGVGEVSS